MTGSDDRALTDSLIGLTFATGLVDAVSFLGLGHIFTANMTGNVVLLGFALGGAAGFSIPALLTSMGAFVVGATLGGRAIVHLSRDRPRWLTVAFGAEAVLVGVAGLLAIGLDIDPSGARHYAVIAALALAMGVRNATVRRLAVPDLTTTVLTMTVTGLAVDSRPAGSAAIRPWRRFAAVAAMLLGALAGALMIDTSLALPLAAAAVIALIPLVPVRRRGAAAPA